MRHQIGTAWKTWWRYKLAIVLAVIVTFVWGGLQYFLANKMFRGMGGPGAQLLTFADATLPMSIEWYCRVAFYISLTLGAGVIAGDVQSGAFTLYFSRSVRPRDYVAGKLAGYGVIVATLTMAGPLLLAALRLGMSDTTDELVDHLSVVPKALAVGGIATLAYATVPLGFSALVHNRRYALGLWAAYYLVFGTIVQTIGFLSGGSIAALDLPTAVATVAFDLFDAHPLFGRRAAWQLSTNMAIASIVVHAIVAIGIVWYEVAKSQRTGVGGTS